MTDRARLIMTTVGDTTVGDEDRADTRCEALIEALHGYDTPEIVALPITGGLPACLGWLEAETGRSA